MSVFAPFASPADYEEEPVRDGRWRRHGWASVDSGMASTKKAEVFCLSGVRTVLLCRYTKLCPASYSANLMMRKRSGASLWYVRIVERSEVRVFIITFADNTYFTHSYINILILSILYSVLKKRVSGGGLAESAFARWTL